jgi:C4-dicarboxylate transporter DctM subunit
LVHSPIGMKVLNIDPLACDVTLVETFKGVMPFFLPDFAGIAALLFFPSIALVLVHTFHG